MQGATPASDLAEALDASLAVASFLAQTAVASKPTDRRRQDQLREVAALLAGARSIVEELHAEPEASERVSDSSGVSEQRLVVQAGLLKGPRTQEYDFYVPILEALVELGGGAPARQVLQILAEKMHDQFTPEDLRPISSVPGQPRWDKTANWARQELTELGYIVRPGTWGIWEISDSGRAWLAGRLRELGRN